MSCNKAFNIKNVPINARWEIEEAFCTSTKDLTAASLGGKYFVISNSAGTRYKVWFDVDNASTEPVVASTTSLAVELLGTDAPASIATKLAAAVNAVVAAGYTGTVSSSTTIVFIYDDTSLINAPEQGTAGALLNLTRGQIGGSIDLGLLDGDVTFDPSVETLDVTAHQTGLVVQSQLITSIGGTVSLTLKEYSPALYRAIYEAIGGKVATTSVVGFGSEMVGRNLLGSAKRLTLHPVYKAAIDLTEDYTVWKAVPSLGSITFSGENPNTLPLEFTAYIDDSKNSAVNVWAYGDVTTLP
jgi:hypothetical protein